MPLMLLMARCSGACYIGEKSDLQDKCMSKLDEIKEILNTLRVAMSLSFGILVVTITGLVNRVDADRVDTLFWVGIAFSVLLVLVIFMLFIKISDKTKQIGGL